MAEKCSNGGVNVDDVGLVVVMERGKLIVRVKRIMMVIMIKLIVMSM